MSAPLLALETVAAAEKTTGRLLVVYSSSNLALFRLSIASVASCIANFLIFCDCSLSARAARPLCDSSYARSAVTARSSVRRRMSATFASARNMQIARCSPKKFKPIVGPQTTRRYFQKRVKLAFRRESGRQALSAKKRRRLTCGVEWQKALFSSICKLKI